MRLNTAKNAAKPDKRNEIKHQIKSGSKQPHTQIRPPFTQRFKDVLESNRNGGPATRCHVQGFVKEEERDIK